MGLIYLNKHGLDILDNKNTVEGKLFVLGLARTGLIFTENQEGTQSGRLTPPGQTEQGIRYHVP